MGLLFVYPIYGKTSMHSPQSGFQTFRVFSWFIPCRRTRQHKPTMKKKFKNKKNSSIIQKLAHYRACRVLQGHERRVNPEWLTMPSLFQARTNRLRACRLNLGKPFTRFYTGRYRRCHYHKGTVTAVIKK